MRSACILLLSFLGATTARAEGRDVCARELSALRAYARESTRDSALLTSVRATAEGRAIRAEVRVSMPGGEISARVFRARSGRVAARAVRVYLDLVGRARAQAARPLAVPVAPAAAIEATRIPAPAAPAPTVARRAPAVPSPGLALGAELASGLLLAAGPTPDPALAATAEFGLSVADRYRFQLRGARTAEQHARRGEAHATFRATSIAPAIEARAVGPLFATAALEFSSIVGRSESSAMPLRRRGGALAVPLGLAGRVELGRASLTARAELALPVAGDRFVVVTPRGESEVHTADRAGFRGALLLGWSLFDPEPTGSGHLEAR